MANRIVLASEARKKANKISYHGDKKSMNLDGKTYKSILNCRYFHSLVDVCEYEDVLELLERDSSNNVQAYNDANSTGVSHLWCLVYKFHTCRPTKKQLLAVLRHPAVHVRIVGILHVRYSVDSEEFIDYLGRFLESDYEDADFEIILSGRKTTLRNMIVSLLTDNKCCRCVLPSIPRTAQAKINAYLEERNLLREKKRSADDLPEERSKRRRRDSPDRHRDSSDRHRDSSDRHRDSPHRYRDSSDRHRDSSDRHRDSPHRYSHHHRSHRE